MTDPPHSHHPVSSLNEVLITAELASCPSRAPDYDSENRALGLLAQDGHSSRRRTGEIRGTHHGALQCRLCRHQHFRTRRPARHLPSAWRGSAASQPACTGFTAGKESLRHGDGAKQSAPFQRAASVLPGAEGRRATVLREPARPQAGDGGPIGTLWAPKHAQPSR
jgi:hypothetical protein